MKKWSNPTRRLQGSKHNGETRLRSYDLDDSQMKKTLKRHNESRYIVKLHQKCNCTEIRYRLERRKGFYGSLRNLRDYKKTLYSQLMLTGKLWTSLTDLNEICVERRDNMMARIMEAEDVTGEGG